MMYPASFSIPSSPYWASQSRCIQPHSRYHPPCYRDVNENYLQLFLYNLSEQNQVVQYHKMLSPNVTFMSLSQIEEYIKRCKLWHLNLDNEEVWSKAYFPAVRITDNPEVYKGRVEFRHIQVWLISEPLLGCSPLPDWLRKRRCIYSIDNKGDNFCVWQCLVIVERISNNQARLAENTTRDAPKPACEFYSNPKLRVAEVELTKMIDFENIASRRST